VTCGTETRETYGQISAITRSCCQHDRPSGWTDHCGTRQPSTCRPDRPAIVLGIPVANQGVREQSETVQASQRQLAFKYRYPNLVRAIGLMQVAVAVVVVITTGTLGTWWCVVVLLGVVFVDPERGILLGARLGVNLRAGQAREHSRAVELARRRLAPAVVDDADGILRAVTGGPVLRVSRRAAPARNSVDGHLILQPTRTADRQTETWCQSVEAGRERLAAVRIVAFNIAEQLLYQAFFPGGEAVVAHRVGQGGVPR
jgi:hypothetical protein